MKHFIVALLLMSGMYSQAAPASLVYDMSNDLVVSQEGEDVQRPIASITKLMTAMVVLDNGADMHESVTVNRRVGTSLPKKEYTRLELLHALLVRSDNAAAETLAENYPGGRSAFVWAMNNKSQSLGLDNTRFVDPSGLGVFNVSTMREITVMLKKANSYELIRDISTQHEIKLPADNRSRWVKFFNTNYMALTRFSNIVISKTGFTNPAGFCVAMVMNQGGRNVAVIVLGEKNKTQRSNTIDRIVRPLV